jgi:hypothetical protein
MTTLNMKREAAARPAEFPDKPQAAAYGSIQVRVQCQVQGPVQGPMSQQSASGSHGYDKIRAAGGLSSAVAADGGVTDRSAGRVFCHADAISKRDDAHLSAMGVRCTETVNLSKPERRLPAIFLRGRQGFDPNTFMFGKWRRCHPFLKAGAGAALTSARSSALHLTFCISASGLSDGL